MNFWNPNSFDVIKEEVQNENNISSFDNNSYDISNMPEQVQAHLITQLVKNQGFQLNSESSTNSALLK